MWLSEQQRRKRQKRLKRQEEAAERHAEAVEATDDHWEDAFELQEAEASTPGEVRVAEPTLNESADENDQAPLVVEAFVGDEEELMTTLVTKKERRKRTSEEIKAAKEGRRVAVEAHACHIRECIKKVITGTDAVASDESIQAMILSVLPNDTVLPPPTSGKPRTLTLIKETVSRLLLYFATRWTLAVDADWISSPSGLFEIAAKGVEEFSGTAQVLSLLLAAASRGMGLRARCAAPLVLPKTWTETLHSSLQAVGAKTDQVRRRRPNSNQQKLPNAQSQLIFVELFLVDTCTNNGHAVGDWYRCDPQLGTLTNPIDASSNKDSLDCPISVANLGRFPMAHIAAVENGNYRDISRRYQPWAEIEKVRAPSKLFLNVISSLSTRGDLTGHPPSKPSVVTTQDKDEQEAMQKKTEPIPTTQGAFRNHPNYAIEKFLRANEILHPKKPVLGIVAGMPVFPRSCVKKLQTRDRWFRQLRRVREDEKATRLVEPKKTKQVVDAERQQDEISPAPSPQVELFGEWQTEALQLPQAENGLVPKTKHGNVELWTKEHLPGGCQHVSFPFAGGVCRRLAVDFAPALVGFDFKRSRHVPKFDGVVVCDENYDQVMDSCLEVLAEEKRKQDAVDKEEASNNWKRLLKAIRVRAKVQRKYGGAIRNDETYQSLKRSHLPISHAEGSSEQNVTRAADFGSMEHEHDFVVATQKGADGSWTKQCKICNMAVNFEHL